MACNPLIEDEQTVKIVGEAFTPYIGVVAVEMLYDGDSETEAIADWLYYAVNRGMAPIDYPSVVAL